jgi:uncharacterized tellurite resistance protein B-like protein
MKEKLSLLADLVKLAKADQEFRQEEQNFLQAIALQMEVSPKDFMRVFEENIEFQPPKNELDRVLQLQRLILVMSIDGHASKKEIELVKQLSISMGLSPMFVDAVLIEMKQHPNNMIPPNRLIELYQVSQN